ncbi:lipid-A-disaccharide synthase [bacterium]|nr:MAG: lipid-A-disaccharide synthase [bacterium]
MGTGRPHRVFISCGEASGDRWAAALVGALREKIPGLEITALAGPETRAAGATLVRDTADLAIMGFAEVVRQLPRLWRAEKELARHIADAGIDLFVPIDFPGFNSRLANHARRSGVPVFWLIAPQVWAWGSWRVGGYRRRIDRLGTILPFETEYFERRGFDVFPMGHPLMEDYGDTSVFERELAAREARLTGREMLTVGLLPGSRRQELNHLLPQLAVAARTMRSLLGGRPVRFLASAAPGVDREQLSRDLDGVAEATAEPLSELLPRLDAALVCSGTASLETALAGVPHDIIYRTGALNHWLARRLVRGGRIGLANLILDADLVPERVQGSVAPLPLARGVMDWVNQPVRRTAFHAGVRQLRALCGRPGVWERTATAITAMLGENGP